MDPVISFPDDNRERSTMLSLRNLCLRSCLVLSIIAVILAAAMSTAGTAAADTFTVTNNNDSGLGSLKKAIMDAKANPGVDFIHFMIPGEEPHAVVSENALSSITESAAPTDSWTRSNRPAGEFLRIKHFSDSEEAAQVRMPDDRSRSVSEEKEAIPSKADQNASVKPAPALPALKEKVDVKSAAKSETKRIAPKAEASPVVKAAVPKNLFAVSVASFKDETNADKLLGELKLKGFDAYTTHMEVKGGERWIRVNVGRDLSRGEADELASKLGGLDNLSPWVVKK